MARGRQKGQTKRVCKIKDKIIESGLAPRLIDEEVKTLDLIRELKSRGQQNNTQINEQTFRE